MLSQQVLDEIHKLAKSSGKNFFSPMWSVFERHSDLTSQSLSSRYIQFPVICKSLDACGSSESHHMCLVLNEEGIIYVFSYIFYSFFSMPQDFCMFLHQ